MVIYLLNIYMDYLNLDLDVLIFRQSY